MKRLLSKKAALFVAGGMLIISACNKSPYPDYEKAEEGLYYKFFKHNENGKKVSQEGDMLKLTMICKNSKDSITFNSQEFAPGAFGFQYSKTTFGGLFMKALSMMASGDSVSFAISADSIFNKNLPAEQIPPFVEKGTMLILNFKVDTILTKEEVKKEEAKQMEEYKIMMELRKNEEPKILANYLQENKVKIKPTKSGLYFIETLKGNGKKPQDGEEVLINYTGRFVTGEIFDTSDEETAKQAGIYNPKRNPVYGPTPFVVGGKVIAGLTEGLKMMNPGSKAKMIIPSEIAYGDGQGMVEPYATLIFDVEFVSYAPTK
jgi:FKBP-type peptidyl-prolyl cis-trans isomerase